MSTILPQLEDFEATAQRLAPHVARTPLVEMQGSGVWLKAESLHPSGAFKLRGAFNAILALDEAARRRGVVAHSSGNHAMAVAYAARALGVRATIVMPDNAPAAKHAGVLRFGGAVVEVGPDSDERMARASELAAEHGWAMIDPYDAIEIVEATGTIALEILSDRPEVEEIYVPVSGGGLIGGIALAAKLAYPAVRIIGVEPEVAADAFASWRAGELTALPGDMMARTIADGLRVNRLGALNWEIFRRHVDEVVTVSEASILRTMARIAREARLVAEPSGAVAAAGLLATGRPTGNAVAILTGGNCDAAFLSALATDPDLPEDGQ